ncbi:MAG: EFR1 family ferrodoxin [Rikenellaceae bacterium]
MICYFSATGNSLWAARQLFEVFNEPLVNIAEALKQEKLNYTLSSDEKLFFVYPVHSWGPAVLVKQFIQKMKLEGYTNQKVYSISTCGSDCANTSKIIKRWLAAKGITLTAAYSIPMPNTYILMNGFDTDSREEEQQKLSEAPTAIAKVVEAIKHQQCPKELYHYTAFPAVKSTLLYSAFVRFTIGKTSFHATDKCISCGLCEQICPTNTITMIDGKPTWGNTCVQCTACIHRCPVQAIEWGKVTQNKGRYHHPELKN